MFLVAIASFNHVLNFSISDAQISKIPQDAVEVSFLNGSIILQIIASKYVYQLLPFSAADLLPLLFIES